MNYCFNEKIKTPLCKIMGENNSDKGNINITKSWHNYTTFYYSIFKNKQHDTLRIFELGIGTNNTKLKSNMGKNGRPGASLYGWSKFFINSKIYGADIDKDILFNNDKIKTFYCDQTQKKIIINMWNTNDELKEPFNIIIEDGLHTFDSSVCFFENSIYKLSTKGYYIIEDIKIGDINKYKVQINKWKIMYPNLLFTLLQIPSSRNKKDNNLLIIYNNN